MRAVDLKFKGAVERFIRDNLDSDLNDEIISLLSNRDFYYGGITLTTIDRMLSNENARNVLYSIATLFKLLSALKIKSPKFSMVTPIKMRGKRLFNDSNSIMITLDFDLKHSSTVFPIYLLYNIIYPRINTILLVLHKRYNITFELMSFPFIEEMEHLESQVRDISRDNHLAEIPAMEFMLSLADLPDESDGTNRAEELVTGETIISHINLEYRLFSSSENSFLPLCSTIKGIHNGVVAQILHHTLHSCV